MTHPQHALGSAGVRLLGSLVAILIAASATALVVHGDSGSSDGAAASTPTIPSPSASATPAPAAALSTTPAPVRTVVVYVVHPGDNLTVIAAWFHQHGYGALYERNKAVIGDDPNLILVGERIVISDGTMTVSG